MKDVILHNSRCSKSRGAIELLEERGAGIPVREYLKEPPSERDLREIVKLLGVRPIDIVRRGEKEFKDLGLRDATPDADVIRAMAEHPILIERPIVVHNGKAAIGRPLENILDIL
jgi:arsenate reductase